MILYARQQKRHRSKEQAFGLWEKVRVGWFERVALKHIYYHMWNRLSVQVWCMRKGAQGWCIGMWILFQLEENCFTILCWFHNQHKSATDLHMSPPSWTSLPPPTPSHPSRLSQSPRPELPASYGKFPLAVYFTYGNVYVSMLLSQFVPPSPSSAVSTSLFSMSASLCLPCK